MTIIVTQSGKHFDYSNPLPSMINIEDIARGLAHSVRFAGQTARPYTVAQHSVECSYLVPEQFALEALLHDASEAYCKDIPQPLKKLLPDYKVIERKVDLAIRAAFGLPCLESIEVKKADIQSLKNEMASFGVISGYKNQMLEDLPQNRYLSILSTKDAFYVFKERFLCLALSSINYLQNPNLNYTWRGMALDFEY